MGLASDDGTAGFIDRRCGQSGSGRILPGSRLLIR